VFTSVEVKERVLVAMTSRSVNYKNLMDLIESFRSPTFLDNLGENLDALLPTIEASIVCPDGSVTLADGMYYCCEKHASVSLT
jgi:hypothetical protein